MQLNASTPNSVPLNGTAFFAVPLVVYVQPDRIRKGDRTTVSFTAPETPRPVPTMDVLDGDGNSVLSLPVPLVAKPLDFARRFMMPHDAALGSYSVAASFTGVSGIRYAGAAPLELVAGGDYGGSVVSLFASERPEATRVIAQLSSGRLVQGDNPHL